MSRRLRRAKTLFGALVATAALVMAVQVVAPVSAMAMIDNSCEDLGDCTGGGGWESGGGGGETGGGWDDGGGGGGSWDGGGGSQGSGGDQGGGWDEGSGDQGVISGDEVIVIEDTKPEEPLVLKDRYCASLGGYIGALDECPSPANQSFSSPAGSCSKHTSDCRPHLRSDPPKKKPRERKDDELKHALTCASIERTLKQFKKYKQHLMTIGQYSRELWKESKIAEIESTTKAEWYVYSCDEIYGGQT